MNHIGELLADLRHYTDHELPNYTDILERACALCDPIFVKDRYAEFFWNCASTVPGWLPQVVLANAETESDGSAKLLSIWRQINYNTEVESKILAHAKDEARHSRLFVLLVGLAFPKLLSSSVIDKLKSSMNKIERLQYKDERSYISEDVIMDDLIQINIGEIRTRLHMNLLAPAIYAFTPHENKRIVRRVLESLAGDEVRHIGYTAQLMEQWAHSGDADRIAHLYNERLAEFQIVTIRQTQNVVRDFGQGKFPDLLEL